jgi:RNA polymerase primary sigma factor
MKKFKIQERITERDETVNRYFADLKGKQYEPLKLNEELELSRKIQNGCERSLDKLVKANMRFVISVAKKYDDTKGYKFISYAVWWVRQQIMQSLSDNSQQIRMPLNHINLENKIKKAVSELSCGDGYDPTSTEIAEHLGVSVSEVENCYTNDSRNVTSLDKPINEEGTNTVEDTLPNDLNAETLTKESDLKVETNVLLSKLNDRNQKIINHLFGLNGHVEKSKATLAEEFGMTEERIRQLKVESLKKMREYLA